MGFLVSIFQAAYLTADVAAGGYFALFVTAWAVLMLEFWKNQQVGTSTRLRRGRRLESVPS